MEQPNEIIPLMTPASLQSKLQEQFKIYRNYRKVEGERSKLKALQEAPELATTSSLIATFFKTTAIDLTSKISPTHSLLTKWVEKMMADILAQKASPLKKMTDLTILLRALIVYISETRHSKELSHLCKSVYNDLWHGTPDDQKGEKNDRDQFENRFTAEIKAMHKFIDTAYLSSLTEVSVNGPCGCSKCSNKIQTMLTATRSSEIFTNKWLLLHNITPDNPPEASLGATYDNFLEPSQEIYRPVVANDNNSRAFH
jgi:hypothetical protein